MIGDCFPLTIQLFFTDDSNPSTKESCFSTASKCYNRHPQTTTSTTTTTTTATTTTTTTAPLPPLPPSPIPPHLIEVFKAGRDDLIVNSALQWWCHLQILLSTIHQGPLPTQKMVDITCIRSHMVERLK